MDTRVSTMSLTGRIVRGRTECQAVRTSQTAFFSRQLTTIINGGLTMRLEQHIDRFVVLFRVYEVRCVHIHRHASQRLRTIRRAPVRKRRMVGSVQATEARHPPSYLSATLVHVPHDGEVIGARGDHRGQWRLQQCQTQATYLLNTPDTKSTGAWGSSPEVICTEPIPEGYIENPPVQKHATSGEG